MAQVPLRFGGFGAMCLKKDNWRLSGTSGLNALGASGRLRRIAPTVRKIACSPVAAEFP